MAGSDTFYGNWRRSQRSSARTGAIVEGSGYGLMVYGAARLFFGSGRLPGRIASYAAHAVAGVVVSTAGSAMQRDARRGGQHRAINLLIGRARQERRSRAALASSVQVAGHYARGPNGVTSWVRQHTRRVT